MKKILFILGFSFLWLIQIYAQAGDTVRTAKSAAVKTQAISPVYYGGTVGLSFGNYFRLSIMPLVGYQLSPKVSGGIKVSYEYIKDKRYSSPVTYHNYGGSVFARFRLNPKLYLHSEFAYISYKYKISDFESDREWVPFLYLGGGYIQPISASTSFFVEVLVDVLQDKNSPYEKWDPYVSVGIGVGF
jgi:hypothetical protein